MRYEFINPQDMPPIEEMRTDKFYSTRIVDVKVDNDKGIVIRLEYLGEEYDKTDKSKSSRCLFPVYRLTDN